jgi:hypothetical protein
MIMSILHRVDHIRQTCWQKYPQLAKSRNIQHDHMSIVDHQMDRKQKFVCLLVVCSRLISSIF